MTMSCKLSVCERNFMNAIILNKDAKQALLGAHENMPSTDSERIATKSNAHNFNTSKVTIDMPILMSKSLRKPKSIKSLPGSSMSRMKSLKPKKIVISRGF